MHAIVAATIGAATLLPRAANACPLCFASSSSRVLYAFYLSTAFLTLLPFVLVGGAIWYLYQEISRQQESLARTSHDQMRIEPIARSSFSQDDTNTTSQALNPAIRILPYPQEGTPHISVRLTATSTPINGKVLTSR